jgi:hypothetical protein
MVGVALIVGFGVGVEKFTGNTPGSGGIEVGTVIATTTKKPMKRIIPARITSFKSNFHQP